MSAIRVLALDSAFGGLSVATAEGAVGLWSVAGQTGAKAAESLPGLVQYVLRGTTWQLADLDRIAVTLGPGGFTSLRAGLAFAKGLAMGAGKPLMGFTTLEALAASVAPGATPLAAVIDAKRDEVFLQVFDFNVTPLSAAAVVPLAQLGGAFDWPDEFRVCGSGAPLLVERVSRAAIDTGVSAPDAAALALYCQRFDPQARPAEAVYLRPADARPMA